MARLPRQSESQPDVSIRRTLFVAAFVAFWMVGISVRLVYLQVSRHEKLIERAHQQQRDAIEITPVRGLVLDRKDRELARTIDTTSVFVAPDEFAQEKKNTETQIADAIECTAAGLSSVMGLDRASVSNQITKARKAGRRFLWIARRIAPEQAQALETMKLTAVHTRKEPKRFYPNGSLAANVLGFVGLDGQRTGGHRAGLQPEDSR